MTPIRSCSASAGPAPLSAASAAFACTAGSAGNVATSARATRFCGSLTSTASSRRASGSTFIARARRARKIPAADVDGAATAFHTVLPTTVPAGAVTVTRASSVASTSTSKPVNRRALFATASLSRKAALTPSIKRAARRSMGIVDTGVPWVIVASTAWASASLSARTATSARTSFDSRCQPGRLSRIAAVAAAPASSSASSCASASQYSASERRASSVPVSAVDNACSGAIAPPSPLRTRAFRPASATAATALSLPSATTATASL